MNGAAAVEEKRRSAASNSKTMRRGRSQNFLFCFRKSQNSVMRLPCFCREAFSNSFSGADMLCGRFGILELPEVLRCRGWRGRVDPMTSRTPFPFQIQRITSDQAHEEAHGSEEAEKQEHEDEVGHHDADAGGEEVPDRVEQLGNGRDEQTNQADPRTDTSEHQEYVCTRQGVRLDPLSEK